MNSKFAVDLRDYITVSVECPDCHAHYQLKLRRDHSILCQKTKGRVLVRCPECAKSKKLGSDNFEIKGRN